MTKPNYLRRPYPGVALMLLLCLNVATATECRRELALARERIETDLLDAKSLRATLDLHRALATSARQSSRIDVAMAEVTALISEAEARRAHASAVADGFADRLSDRLGRVRARVAAAGHYGPEPDYPPVLGGYRGEVERFYRDILR